MAQQPSHPLQKGLSTVFNGQNAPNLGIKALERGAAPPSLFVDRERTMFAFVDEVLDTYTVRDETFVAVREMFSAGEILELLLLIGYFRMVSSVMTTLQVELEPSFGAKILDMVRETACRLALTKPRGMLCPNGTVKPFLVSLVEPVAYLKSELVRKR